MADRDTDILLIGGGIASATAAATLRAEGFDGSIVLAGRELDPPYHRPPASKGYLEGREAKADALIHPDGWWEEHGVELRTRTSVMALDPAARTATLQTKEQIGFGQALVATGAMVRRLAVDGAQLDGIHYLRVLDNADTIRRDTEGAEHVVCVGGSYIACEVAASLTALGRRVTVLMQEAEPLERTFGARAGTHFRAVLEGHGVEVLGCDEVERFEASGEGEGERVARVITRGGRALAADAVVCGVGAQPDVTLAARGSRSATSAACAATAACAPPPTPCSPPATSASTTASCTAASCASSTRTSPPRRARPPRATCSAPTSRTTSCPTSSPT
jgi:3-phenylpropionate/trans-cinnamate dioxygenase ferredoxin reductase subunit